MNRFLFINNKRITTFKELKVCFEQTDSTIQGSELFTELIDNLVDKRICQFLYDIGEVELAKRVDRIEIGDSDTEIMKQLMVIITEKPESVVFNPLQYLEILFMGVEEGYAVFSVKVKRQTTEKVEIGIKQGEESVHHILKLNELMPNEEVTYNMSVSKEGVEVLFLINGLEVGKTFPNPDKLFTVNGVSFLMKLVEGGTFWMGAQNNDSNERNFSKDARDSEEPVHKVILSSFYMAEAQVTQDLWLAIMGSNPSHFKSGQKPVDSVSWEDCQEFIRRLNVLKLTEKKFRLPTEAEWEYAAKGGKINSENTFSGDCSIKYCGWYTYNSEGKTHPVKQKKPNELEIYDMSGNVWEWCSDRYGRYKVEIQTNPQGSSKGSGRVMRGGSYCNVALDCKVYRREYYSANYQNENVGFRLVLSC